MTELTNSDVPPLRAADTADVPAVRMTITANLAARLAEHLIDVRGTQREAVLCEQLWLRAVLVEQRRRTVVVERASFDAQADRLLAALDPPAVRRDQQFYRREQNGHALRKGAPRDALPGCAETK